MASESVLVFGFKKCAYFGLHIWAFPAFKVTAFWQWLRWAASRCGPGQKPLFVNLDETSLGVHMKGRAGVVATARTPGGLATALGVKPKLADLRGAITHVAMVCDCSWLQPLLPQVLIGNKRKFTKKLLKAVKAPPAVHLLAEKSSWNSAAVMVKIIDLLAAALEPHRETHLPVLLLDCCTCHLTNAVLERARSKNILLVCVPASTTHLLQPLDTRVFHGYKEFLAKGFLKLQLESEDGTVSPVAWLRLLTEAATHYLRAHRWEPAFISVGAGASSYEQLSSALRCHDLPFDVPLKPLSPTQLQAVLPKGKRLMPSDFSSLAPPRRRLRTKTSLS